MPCVLKTSAAHPSRWILLFIKRIIYIIQMKKHYEKMCMTPLGFVFEGTLLAGSIETEVRATGHEIGNTFDGTEEGGGEFNLDWE